MSSKTRLANKTQWSLSDIVRSCGEAREIWQQSMTKAERDMDPVQLAYLGRLRDKLAFIEQRARNALRGEYP